MPINLDQRETAAVLAGLRMLQSEMEAEGDQFTFGDTLTDGGTIAPPTTSEIDDLCEKINVDTASPLDLLSEVYQDYCKRHGLPMISADEQVYEQGKSGNVDHQRWLSRFTGIWASAEEDIANAANTHSYKFDVKLLATVSVTARNEKEAQRKLRDLMNGAEGNFGSYPDGSPILSTVCMDDGKADLLEIDGEAV